MSIAEVIQLQKKQEAKFVCSACGADRGCQCNAPAVEKLAELKEKNRIAARESMRRKRKQNQESVNVNSPTETEANEAANRAEARCAAQYKAFTAQEERNAVSNILEAIRDLSDEQRALLFQTLKESYQWNE